MYKKKFEKNPQKVRSGEPVGTDLATRLRSREPEKNSVWPLVNALLGVRRLDFGGYTLRLPLIGCIVANFIKLFFGEVTQDF